MPAGRPRKPDEIHILEGTYRPDRHGDPAERVDAPGEPAAPAHLAGEALAFWQEVVPPLAALGVARAADAPALAAMCEWYVRYCKQGRALDKMGAGSKRLYQQTVLVAVCWDKFSSIAARFGLTPSDRAKLRMPAEKKTGGVASRKRNA